MSLRTYESQLIGDSIFNVRNINAIKNDMLAFVKDLAKVPADTVKVRVGHENVYLIKHPNDIRKALITHHKSFDKSTPGYAGLRSYLGQGLLSSNSKSWSLHRRLAQPSFQAGRVNDYFPIFRNQARKKITGLSNLASEATDLNLLMASLTLSILGDTLLIFDLDQNSDSLAGAINCIFATTAKRIYNPFSIPKFIPTKSNCAFTRAKETIRDVISKLLDENYATKMTKLSLIHDLMEFKDDQGKKLNFQEIFDEIITMIQAGHETSSNALIWTFLHLQENFDVREKVCEEVLKLPDNYSSADLDALPYLQALIFESLRLDPPAWAFDRRALDSTQLKDVRIKKGDLVLIAPIITHRLPQYWSTPDSFNVNHFLGKKMGENMAYLPFGLGPRFCIGQQFAMLEIKTIIAEFLRAGNLVIQDPHLVQREGSVTLRPQSKVMAKLQRLTV